MGGWLRIWLRALHAKKDGRDPDLRGSASVRISQIHYTNQC